MQRPRRLRALWFAVLIVATVAAAWLSVTVGSREVALEDVLAALGGSLDSIDQAAVAKRVPRTLLALLVGAALGFAGAVMQGVTRNPLADPGILGVNMGASLAIAIGIAWFGIFTHSALIWTAVAGAAIVSVAVYVVGSLGRGGATPLKLALSGAAISAALASFITAIVLPRADIAGSVRSWQIGGVGGATLQVIAPAVPFFVAGFAICLLSARGLNSLALGDDLAAGLGERVAVVRAVAALGAVLLCGTATALAGPIGFVGLVVPHLCRLLIGVDNRWLLPFSAVSGGLLLSISDVVGRVIARPSEIDVGIITALIGAPFFIWIVRRQKANQL